METFELRRNKGGLELVGKADAPRIIELERDVKKLSVEVRCAAPKECACDDKMKPDAFCFAADRPCDRLQFVKVESAGAIVV